MANILDFKFVLSFFAAALIKKSAGSGLFHWAVLDSNQQASELSQAIENTQLTEKHAENSKTPMVQNRVHNSEISPELQQIITAWPNLPEHIKAAVKALIQTYSTETKKL